MCGIIGVCGNDTLNEEVWISQQLPSLRSRGPDNLGTKYFGNSAILGASRLAMVDNNILSNQPYSKGNYGLVFNGEIFNHLALREDYLQHIQFETQSDTETIFELIKECGVESLTNLEGMYALAFYNHERREITLARDCLGKKPLYYLIEKDRIVFSSSVFSLKNRDSKKLNQESLINYLTIGFDPIYTTPFVDLKSIPAGYCRTWKLEIGKGPNLIRDESSRRLIPRNRCALKGDLSQDELVLKLREFLIESVKTRVEGQEKVALSLSGGVDSTILAIILGEVGQKFKCFSASWVNVDKARYNADSTAAKSIAKSIGCEFQLVEIENPRNLIDSIDEYLLTVEEPNTNPTGLTMMKLYSAISKDGFRCALTGDGADEFFYGYLRYKRISSAPIGLIRTFKAASIKNVVSRISRVNQLFQLNFQGWARWHENLELEFVKEFLCFQEHAFRKLQQDRNSVFKEWLIGIGDNIYGPTRASFLDVNGWLIHESNARVDKVSMKHSVEVRLPFQDFNLIEHFWQQVEGLHNSPTEKPLLRMAFPELQKLPILNEKTGFVSPLGHWMRLNQEAIEEEFAFMQKKGVFRSHLSVAELLSSKDFSKIKRVWSLLVYARWLRICNMV